MDQTKEIENVVNKLGLTKDSCSFDEYFSGDYSFKIIQTDPYRFPSIYVKKGNKFTCISFGLLKNLKKESIFDMLDSEFNRHSFQP